MVTLLMILMVLGACTAYPTEDETRPPNAVGAPAVGSEPVVPITELHLGPVAADQEQGPDREKEPDREQGPGVESGPDESDLKTDNTVWWRRSHYPYAYGRSYYRPRAYTYYTPRVYSYYSPYSYWGSYW